VQRQLSRGESRHELALGHAITGVERIAGVERYSTPAPSSSSAVGVLIVEPSYV